MSNPAIRYIVTTFASKGQDGSRYHYAHVRSTISGRLMFVQSTGGDLAGKVAAVAGDDSAVYSVQVELGRYDWKRSNPTAARHGHQVTREDILELEVVRELQI